MGFLNYHMEAQAVMSRGSRLNAPVRRSMTAGVQVPLIKSYRFDAFHDPEEYKLVLTFKKAGRSVVIWSRHGTSVPLRWDSLLPHAPSQQRTDSGSRNRIKDLLPLTLCDGKLTGRPEEFFSNALASHASTFC
jgi:hypothetical protein